MRPGQARDRTREELRRRFEGEVAVLADGPRAAGRVIGEGDGEFVAGGVGGRKVGGPEAEAEGTAGADQLSSAKVVAQRRCVRW